MKTIAFREMFVGGSNVDLSTLSSVPRNFLASCCLHSAVTREQRFAVISQYVETATVLFVCLLFLIQAHSVFEG